MEELIRIKYGIAVDEMREIGNGFVVRSGYLVYKAVGIKKSEEEIKEIVSVLEKHNIQYDKVIAQIDGGIIIEYKKNKYILLEVNKNKTADTLIVVPDKNIDIIDKWKENLDKLEMLLKGDRDLYEGKKEIIEYYKYNAETALKLANEALLYGNVEGYLQKININGELSIENLMFESRIRRVVVELKHKIKDNDEIDIIANLIDNTIKNNINQVKDELLFYSYMFYPEFLFNGRGQEWFEEGNINKLEYCLVYLLGKIKNVEIKSLH